MLNAVDRSAGVCRPAAVAPGRAPVAVVVERLSPACAAAATWPVQRSHRERAGGRSAPRRRRSGAASTSIVFCGGEVLLHHALNDLDACPPVDRKGSRLIGRVTFVDGQSHLRAGRQRRTFGEVVAQEITNGSAVQKYPTGIDRKSTRLNSS